MTTSAIPEVKSEIVVFFCCHFVSCQKPKFGGRQPRRIGVKRIGKEKKEEEGRKGEEKDEEKERNEYKQTPHIR